MMAGNKVNENSSIEEQAALIKSGLGVQLTHSISLFLRTHQFKGSSTLIKLLIKLLIPTPKGPTIIHTYYGFDIIVDPVIDRGIERSIYYHGSYEAGTIDVLKKCLRQGDIFVDVGSNIGLMSLSASKFVGDNGRVYSFEPEPEIFAIFKKNIEMNKISNISSYNIGLGRNRKKAIIYSNLDRNRGSASLIKPNQKNSKGREVLVEALDEFAITNKIANIRMIKIDVEGWELEVLKGANNLLKSPNAPIICIEYSNLHPTQNGHVLDIYNYILTINNYKIYKLEKGKESPSRLIKIADAADLPYHDNLFCFLSTHLKGLQKNMFAKM